MAFGCVAPILAQHFPNFWRSTFQIFGASLRGAWRGARDVVLGVAFDHDFIDLNYGSMAKF